VAHDNPIPGFGTVNTINLRLWAAKPDKEFDLEAFNTGDYVQVCHGLSSLTNALLWLLSRSCSMFRFPVLCDERLLVTALQANGALMGRPG
jgi:hypothetical protein